MKTWANKEMMFNNTVGACMQHTKEPTFFLLTLVTRIGAKSLSSTSPSSYGAKPLPNGEGFAANLAEIELRDDVSRGIELERGGVDGSEVEVGGTSPPLSI